MSIFDVNTTEIRQLRDFFFIFGDGDDDDPWFL